MAHAKGELTLTARGKAYKLSLGLSVLADLQATYGQDVIEQLQPPPDAGANWMPPLAIIRDLFLGTLQRYHADEADRFLVDDLVAENDGAFGALMAASFPDQKPARGNAKGPRRAA